MSVTWRELLTPVMHSRRRPPTRDTTLTCQIKDNERSEIVLSAAPLLASRTIFILPPVYDLLSSIFSTSKSLINITVYFGYLTASNSHTSTRTMSIHSK